MQAGIFGRDAELRAIEAFLDAVLLAARVLVLAGPAGAGKTTLLRVAAERAAGLELTVLQTRPGPGDVRLAFAGLADLLGPELERVLDGLSGPQRRALGAALLIQDAPPEPVEPRVIATAFLSALLVLARSAPVLVVIDDVQWLDPPTAAAVGFAARRIEHEPIGLLCAQRVGRPGQPLPLDLGHARLPAELLPLGGLSLGALHHLLRTRLGIPFSHPALRRIEAESDGNPFIALEIGRALARRGVTRIGAGALPVPDTLSGLVSERLGELPPAVSQVLGMVAVMPGAPIGRYLAAGAAGADLDAAVLAGVLESDAGRLRFSHPLLASAVTASIPPARRRELHAIAATGASDLEARARHRALAADGPSAEVADDLDGAAYVAETRGAPATAAELLELAASLTPADRAQEANRRLLDAGSQLFLAGETRAAATLLEQLVAELPAGPERAEALSLLGRHLEHDFEASTRLLDQALAEAGFDPARTADIRSFRSDLMWIRGTLTEARDEAHQALADAELAGEPALVACTLAQVFLFDWMCGGPADEVKLERALELERMAGTLRERTPPSQAAGWYLVSMGRFGDAEAVLRRALARAEADGAEYRRANILLRLSLLAAGCGESGRAAEVAATGLEIAEQLDLTQLVAALLYASGVAALQLGQDEEVRALAGRGLELSRAAGDPHYSFYHEALLGSLDLAAGAYPAAAARLLPLLGRLPPVGRSPARQGVTADTVEALIATGELEVSGRLLAELEQVPGNPVTAAVTARCRGALAAARGQLDDAVSELTAALRQHDQIDPQPIERGRTLLVLGAVQRRRKQRRAAREALLQAAAIFAATEAALWTARAAAELARVSGRAPGQGELTTTERRVAELVCGGMSNRETAAELFVTVRAVESTLTKVYAKLGVRSRTQLASRLRERS